MGECFILRRGGSVYRVPALNASYPQDAAVSVSDGNAGSAVFNAVISEAGVPAFCTYQWYVDSVAVDGAIESSFTMDNLIDAAVHNVYCEIKNKGGVVTTRRAVLNVIRHDSPVLDSAYPLDSSCEAGADATFEVRIIKNGSSAEYTYQWYVDDEAVDSATEATFKMKNPDLGKHLVYCEITSDAGVVKSRVATVSVDTMILYALNGAVNAASGGWTNRTLYYEPGVPMPCDICKTTVNAIDLTNFSKLRFEGVRYDKTMNTSPQMLCVGVWSSASYITMSNMVAGSHGGGGNVDIDVSRLSGKYYIGYYVYNREYGHISISKLSLKA